MVFGAPSHCHSTLTRGSYHTTPLYIIRHQGHVEAAGMIGSIYGWGQGVVVDYPRAMAAFKVGAGGLRRALGKSGAAAGDVEDHGNLVS